MKGEVSVETMVEAPASLVWGAYRGLELCRLIDELLGDVIGKVEVIEGDGGVGTICKLTYPPGAPGRGYFKEIFKIMDDDKRIKEAEVIEGGYRDFGFDFCGFRQEIIEKEAQSTIVKSIIKYEIDDNKPELVSLIDTKPLQTLAKEIGKYIREKKNNA